MTVESGHCASFWIAYAGCMTLEELRSDLRTILAEEQRKPVDWQKVEELCVQVVDRLNTEPEPAYPHDVVYHFLEDADARQKSLRYADEQREKLRTWLALPG